jgi:hypothetical protein
LKNRFFKKKNDQSIAIEDGFDEINKIELHLDETKNLSGKTKSKLLKILSIDLKSGIDSKI